VNTRNREAEKTPEPAEQALTQKERTLKVKIAHEERKETVHPVSRPGGRRRL
jgi:hypothetical protein